ncbi:MAG TPA: patatin-like phospholipase family protein, partial [Salinimicrobium sp.]|nr:patatin-like phospholipase family protein [Salinimicrobium sp.]
MRIKLLCVLALLWSCYSTAQEKDPEVGLVLSGGGAKGLAHIGALKVIEEAGVQIDYIGGSSMGAIIGSLYAAGYSAHQLDSIFQETNFSVLIQDQLPRSAKTFYEKEDAEKYVLSLPFNNFKISFPSGLSRGQNLYNLMSRLMVHLKDKRDFENLPIPFFAVATDVETGEEVILDSGYLPKAVSASAAIPTLFGPVEINGRLLTDGGVSNNYPVEELRKRGADIVIGVDVQDTLAKREDLNSVFDILTQISNFRTIRAMQGKKEKTDVYINPPIKPFSVVSFGSGRKIIDAGEKAAREKMPELKKIAARQEKEARKEIKITKVDSIYISNVRIVGEQTYPRSYIMGKLKLEYPGKISYNDFIFGINNLTATNNFKKVNYKLIPVNDGYVLELRLEENPTKTFLKLALHYDDLYKSGALVNLTHKSLFFTNDVTSLDLVVGDNFRYNFQYYWDKGYYWSVGLRSRFNTFNKDVGIEYAENKLNISEIDVNQIEIEYADFTNQLYVQSLFGHIFSFGMGLEHKYLEVISETIGDAGMNKSIPSTIFDKSHYYSSFGFLKLDTYDNSYLPT